MDHSKAVSVPTFITAGATYLDIDAYACIIAMSELLQLQGQNVVPYSAACHNYSVCPSLVEGEKILRVLPSQDWEEKARFIIVDISDPEYLAHSVPLERVTAVYDHHVGFEAYWESRIGENAHIEFIGAAATLIYREWKKAGLQDNMSTSTARLLIAAILDNTLNLTSANTTQEDREVFQQLCQRAQVGERWCADYFSEVQRAVEADLKNALLGDLKTVRGNPVLPPLVAQLCVWDAGSILNRLDEIRCWFRELPHNWMINIIDLKHQCNYFVCDAPHHQEKIAEVFGVLFHSGVAKTDTTYLRKELIKKTYKI